MEADGNGHVRDRGRGKGLAHGLLCTCREGSGQSTVEYAIVLAAFLAMVLALGLMWHAAKDGRLLRLAVDAASHGTGGDVTVGFLQDVALF
jgi:hypothetical protein